MVAMVADSVLDASHDKTATATRLTVCAGAPDNFADIANHALADVTLTAGDGNGDFVIANGDTDGRKVTVTAQTDFPIDATGTADHVALDDGTEMLRLFTCTSQPLTSGGTVSTPAFDAEIADPT